MLVEVISLITGYPYRSKVPTLELIPSIRYAVSLLRKNCDCTDGSGGLRSQQIKQVSDTRFLQSEKHFISK